MPSYKSFAIVGSGAIGLLLVEEFLKSDITAIRGYKLRILTRFESKDKPELTDFATKGVDVVGVDYDSQQSIKDALKGADVIFSALRDGGLDIQTNVIRAAKAANVKLFIPSEYGRNTLDNNSEYLKVKADAHALLKQLELPYTLFFCGIWPEMMFESSVGPAVGVDLKAGKFRLFGDGTKAQSWTSPRSTAPFVHHVITTLPPSKLENKIFEIEGDRKSFRDLIALWEKKHGRPADVVERSPAEIQKFIDEATQPIFRFIPGEFANGGMLVSGEANKLWPEWKPVTWEELMP